MTRRRALRAAYVVAAGVSILVSASALAADQPLPPADTTHQQFNVSNADPATENGTPGESTYVNPTSPICATATQPTPSNVRVSCEGTAPHNETSIAANPTNPANIVASANDYQLRLSSGGHIVETIFSRAEVTFDGGRTWTTFPIDDHGYDFTGDPALAFDGAGNVYLVTLGFLVSQGRSPGAVNPDIIVSHSGDGGRTWSTPERVASGSGQFIGPGVFNDKPYITAWGSGNVLVTWTVFNDGQKGSYISSPIDSVISHDGGVSWTGSGEISGSAPFCVASPATSTPNVCNQDQVSVPVHAADGSLYVAFESTADNTTQRDQYLVVKVDPTTGQRTAGPFRVAGLIDGTTDYPLDAAGRQTYQDSQFRSWSAGNIAADPTSAAHLAVVWSDMRNSTVPAPADPYTAKTNSDTVVSQSFDGGHTWSAPAALTAAGDQFMPWAAYDSSGRLRIGYFDRSYDAANHMYGYTLATESAAGSLSFTTAQLTSTLSDPTSGDRWFSRTTVNTSFPHPTSFLGDYSGIAAVPTGGVVALWTDMRDNVCFTVRCGHAQEAFFSAAS
jgi:hypothetical protein